MGSGRSRITDWCRNMESGWSESQGCILFGFISVESWSTWLNQNLIGEKRREESSYNYEYVSINC